jgi:FkbM family methyltransferase
MKTFLGEIATICMFFVRIERTCPPCMRIVTRLYYLLYKARLRLPQKTMLLFSERLRQYVNSNDWLLEMESLKRNLDEASRNSIDRYFIRQSEGCYRYSNFEIDAWHTTRKIRIPYKFPSDTTIIEDVFMFHCGLKFLPSHIVEQIQRGCVIDGGAASGDSPLMFLEYRPARIYAVEPSPLQISEISEVLRLNNIKQEIEIVPYGLSDRVERIKICDQRAQLFEVQTITIDGFAEDKKVSCIKLDIEGIEYSVICGARKTISRDRPILLVSIYHAPEDLFKIKPLIESWRLGYKFMIRDTEPCNSLAGVHLMLIGYCDK